MQEEAQREAASLHAQLTQRYGLPSEPGVPSVGDLARQSRQEAEARQAAELEAQGPSVAAVVAETDRLASKARAEVHEQRMRESGGAPAPPLPQGGEGNTTAVPVAPSGAQASPANASAAGNATAAAAADGTPVPFVRAEPLPGLAGPWVGILASPTSAQCPDAAKVVGQKGAGLFGAGSVPSSCVPSYYADWVAASGARPFGIPFDASDALLDLVATGASAVLLPGGDLVLEPNTTLYQTARRLLDRVINANRAGRVMPLLGICQGAQLLASLVHGSPSILATGAFRNGGPLPLAFTPEAARSELLTTLGRDVAGILAHTPTALHLNANGVRPHAFAASPNLAALFRAVAVATDASGADFVSVMEARTMPLLGVQWHPERAQFDWRQGVPAPHTAEAVAVGSALADALANIARLSPHAMSTPQHRRMVAQTVPAAMLRQAVDEPEAGVASLLFEPPTASADEDGARATVGGHGWRLPADQVTAHRVQAPPSDGASAPQQAPLANATAPTSNVTASQDEAAAEGASLLQSTASAVWRGVAGAMGTR